MDPDQLHSKLLAAARKLPPDARVPDAFPGRVMASLVGRRLQDDAWSLWDRSLWKAAAAATALCLVLNFWPISSWNDPGPLTLETTLVSLAEQLSDSW